MAFGQRRNEKTYYGEGKIFWGGDKRAFGGQKYTKYNKINNNSENFRKARLLPGGLRPWLP